MERLPIRKVSQMIPLEEESSDELYDKIVSISQNIRKNAIKASGLSRRKVEFFGINPYKDLAEIIKKENEVLKNERKYLNSLYKKIKKDSIESKPIIGYSGNVYYNTGIEDVLRNELHLSREERLSAYIKKTLKLIEGSVISSFEESIPEIDVVVDGFSITLS